MAQATNQRSETVRTLLRIPDLCARLHPSPGASRDAHAVPQPAAGQRLGLSWEVIREKTIPWKTAAAVLARRTRADRLALTAVLGVLIVCGAIAWRGLNRNESQPGGGPLVESLGRLEPLGPQPLRAGQMGQTPQPAEVVYAWRQQQRPARRAPEPEPQTGQHSVSHQPGSALDAIPFVFLTTDPARFPSPDQQLREMARYWASSIRSAQVGWDPQVRPDRAERQPTDQPQMARRTRTATGSGDPATR